MEKSTTRRTTAATSIGLSAGLVLTPALAAPAPSAERGETRAARAALTDFGYRGDVYGVRLVTDSVEALTLKTPTHSSSAPARSARSSSGPARPGAAS